MMRFAVVVASVAALATVSGFAPSTVGRQSVKLDATPVEKEIGVLPPVGFFDPMGFLKTGPYGDERANFEHYRGVELKHGRISMAATLGMLTQQNYHFDGFLSPSAGLKFEDVPNGLAALDVVPLAGWVQMAVLIGAHEIVVKQVAGKGPGNFGTGYFGVKLDDQSSFQLRALNVEVSNGRLAMLGILGMFASEIVHKGQVLAETTIFS